MGYVYILTNYNKTVLYTGVTNNLQRRYMNIAWESMIVSLKDITFTILYIMKR